MPIYLFSCGECNKRLELVLPMDAEAPVCCGEPMGKLPTFPAMVKIMGEGGYPSRRKFLNGSASCIGQRSNVKPWLSYDPTDESVKPMGSKDFQ